MHGTTVVGRRAGRETDVIVGELVSDATAHAARRLSRELGLPWVTDLRDPWVLDEMWLYPSGLHRARDTRGMHRSLTAVREPNTPDAALQVFAAAAHATEAIPNGFDSADFEGVEPA